MRSTGNLDVRGIRIRGFMAVALLFAASAADRAVGQRPRGGAQAGREEPLFQEYRGIKIGLLADEVRKKLGSPKDKSDEQDFFVFEEKEMIQIVYDKSHAVSTISVDFLSDAKEIPTPKSVLGSDIEAKPDGSKYKMVRYEKAGYWVSYSRTAGDAPLVTVTMQKFDE